MNKVKRSLKKSRLTVQNVKIHEAHNVTLYKAGKRRAMAKGERHHDREKKGYGGQKYPLQHEICQNNQKTNFTFEMLKNAVTCATKMESG